MKHSGVGAFFFSCQFPSLMCLAFHISNRPLCGYAADVSARICKNQHRLLCLLPPTAFGDFVIGCILWLYGSGSTQGTSDTCLAFRFCQKENYSRSIETTQSSCSNFWIFWTLGVCSFPMFPFRFSDHRLVVAKSSSIQASRQ